MTANPKDLKTMKKEIREEVTKEVLDEIHRVLKREEKASGRKTPLPTIITKTPETPVIPVKAVTKQRVMLSLQAILTFTGHAIKYANSQVPRGRWVEVIGLLGGKLSKDGHVLLVDVAIPLGHGSAIHVPNANNKLYLRAVTAIKKRGSFVCGWYHSHPSYGLFISQEDFETQARYQQLWPKSIALVVDPYLIDGTSPGFTIFRANVSARKWFTVPVALKEPLNARMLVRLVEFIRLLVEGKVKW